MCHSSTIKSNPLARWLGIIHETASGRRTEQFFFAAPPGGGVVVVVANLFFSSATILFNESAARSLALRVLLPEFR